MEPKHLQDLIKIRYMCKEKRVHKTQESVSHGAHFFIGKVDIGYEVESSYPWKKSVLDKNKETKYKSHLFLTNNILTHTHKSSTM